MLTWDELIKEIYKGEKIDMECMLAGKAIPQSVYETLSRQRTDSLLQIREV